MCIHKNATVTQHILVLRRSRSRSAIFAHKHTRTYICIYTMCIDKEIRDDHSAYLGLAEVDIEKRNLHTQTHSHIYMYIYYVYT